MLEMMLDKHMIQVVIGLGVVVGVLSKCIVNVSLKRLVRGAGNMGKSSHPFMRLVRAKFEHACMVSEKVENVEVFVDKYLYEYRVAGMKLHSLRRMETTAACVCAVAGLLGGFLEYTVNGMSDTVLTTGAAGVGAGILLYLFHMTTDENYRMEAIRNYMVDYLENVCLHRYEKAQQKEERQKEVQQEVHQTEVPQVEAKRTEPQVEPEYQELKEEKQVMPEMTTVPEMSVVPRILPVSEIKMAKEEGRKREREEEIQVKSQEDKRETPAKEVLIRQILEEFMA